MTKNTFVKLVLGGLLVAGVGACAVPLRNVTHISGWSGPDTDYLYVAYSENDVAAHVKLCRVQPDNSLACVAQPEVDRLLNP